MTGLHAALTFNGMRAVQSERGLDPYTFAAYMAIALSADGYAGTTPPLSYRTIGERAGMTARHARTCVKRLLAARLVKIDTTEASAGDSNRYALLLGGEQRSAPAAEGMNNVPTPYEQCSHPPGTVFTPPMNIVPTPYEQCSHYKDIEDRMKTGTSDQDDQDGGVVVVSNSDGVSEDVAALLETYAAEIGPATPMVRDELGALVERYGAEDVADALRVAVLANVRKLGHVKGTLKNRAREGKLLRDGRQLALMPAVEVTPPKPATTDLRETGAAAPAASWTPPAPMREGPTPPPAASAHDIDAWKTALHQLRLQMPGSPWLEGARLHRAEGDEFVVNVGSPAAREMLQHRLYRNVVRVLSDACGRTVRVLFESPDVAPRLPVFQVQGA